MKQLLLVFVLLLMSQMLFSQSYHSISKKAVKYFTESHKYFVDGKYKDAEIIIDKALDKDGGFMEALMLKAEICVELDKDSLAIELYEHIYSLDPMFNPRLVLPLSKLYAEKFEFDKSIELLHWYLSLDNQKEKYRNYALDQLLIYENRMILVNNPVVYNPKNLGSAINTSDDEYVNQYYVKEKKLVYTKNWQEGVCRNENVWVSIMYDSVWSAPHQLIGGATNIGAANISPDAMEIYYSASTSANSCDIYCIEYVNGRWTSPKNIVSVNTTQWESQPCLSYDGKEMYFVRANKKYGNSDIYVSYREDKTWSSPVRLCSNINTEGNEMSPFIHYDGKTLYFSSDKHPGMGGYDLFVSHRNSNNEWSRPINLGYPLNTTGDEINIVVNNDAQTAYISSIRDGGCGGYDIYEFEIDDFFKPEPVEIEEFSDEEMYAVALEMRESVVLNNINFELNSAELVLLSEDAVDNIVSFLNKYEDVVIMLIGHTDSSGDDENNLELSKRRAESVKKALTDKGVAAERIKTKGCGSSQPLFPNNLDDELRALNRRVSMSLDYQR